MVVITLDYETFFSKCTDLISKIDYQPDLIVGILNGGGYVIDEFKNENKFHGVQFELVKLQRSSNIKNNYIVRFFLKLLPYFIANKFRVYESEIAKETIKTLELDKLLNLGIDFKRKSYFKKNIKNILIVDDAIDTGKTMFIVKNNLCKLFPNAQIKSAVLSWTIECSIFKPDYYLFKNVLVRFPWSMDYKRKKFEKKGFSR